MEVNATFDAIPDERTVTRWAQITSDEFPFDVKLHRLLSRHSAGTDALPKALRRRARTDDRGRVRVDARLQDALLEATLEAVAPLGDKLAGFLLQLTPGFSPRKHHLDELQPIVEALAPHRVAARGRSDHDHAAAGCRHPSRRRVPPRARPQPRGLREGEVGGRAVRLPLGAQRGGWRSADLAASAFFCRRRPNSASVPRAAMISRKPQKNATSPMPPNGSATSLTIP